MRFRPTRSCVLLRLRGQGIAQLLNRPPEIVFAGSRHQFLERCVQILRRHDGGAS